MIYLLDANVVIDANRDYYPMDIVPEFWEWLVHMAGQGRVGMPSETHKEAADGKDDVARWLKQGKPGHSLRLTQEVDQAIVDHVLKTGYAADLTEDELVTIGRDPFLIAHALADPTNQRVVTTENSKPKAQRANRKVPDVCAALGVESRTPFQFIREVGFSTNWKTLTS